MSVTTKTSWGLFISVFDRYALYVSQMVKNF